MYITKTKCTTQCQRPFICTGTYIVIMYLRSTILTGLGPMHWPGFHAPHCMVRVTGPTYLHAYLLICTYILTYALILTHTITYLHNLHTYLKYRCTFPNVCMSICIVYIYLYTYLYIYMYLLIYIYAYSYIPIYKMYILMHLYIYLYIYIIDPFQFLTARHRIAPLIYSYMQI